MKKIIVTALVGALVAGALVAPAAAGKKKKPKAPAPVASELKFFLRWDGDGDCGATYLSITDAVDGGSGCEYTALAAQELLIAGGQGALAREWPASDGVPFVLDATRKITGEITVRGAAAAQSKIEVLVSGLVDGELKEIAKGETATINFGPTRVSGPQVQKFELTPDGALAGKTIESLVLTTTTRGVNALTYYDLEDPVSFIVIPTFK